MIALMCYCRHSACRPTTRVIFCCHSSWRHTVGQTLTCLSTATSTRPGRLCGQLMYNVALQQAEMCVAIPVTEKLCNLDLFHTPSLQGNLGLRFQHPAPVQPGVLGNIGWREEEHLARQGQEAAAAAPAAAAVVAAPKAAANGGLAMFTMEEVEQHASEESAWFVHEGKVRIEAASARYMLQGRLQDCLFSTSLQFEATVQVQPQHLVLTRQKPYGMLLACLALDITQWQHYALCVCCSAWPMAHLLVCRVAAVLPGL